MTAQNLATAIRKCTEAETAHKAALKRAEAIRARIAGAHTRQAEITALRLAGTATEADSAEYACLGGDIAALDQMLTEAVQVFVDADPAPAQQALALARAAHGRAQNKILTDALAEKNLALENALVAGIRQIHNEGPQKGLGSICMSWKPTHALKQAVDNGFFR